MVKFYITNGIKRVHFFDYFARWCELKRAYDLMQAKLTEEWEKNQLLSIKCQSLQREIDSMVKTYDFNNYLDSVIGEGDES